MNLLSKLTIIAFLAVTTAIVASFGVAHADDPMQKPEVTDKTLLKQPVTRELKGVTMPEEMMVNTKKLLLNGMGLREVQILAIYIKVYVAGLYLEKKSSNGDEIINSSSLKVVDLKFLRHVSASDIYESWEKGISNNCVKETCDEAKAKLKELKSVFKSVDEGDMMENTFDSHSVTLTLKGQKLATVDSVPFIKAMLATWIGQKPVTDELKQGLLGGKN